MILIAVCPGGQTSSVITHLGGGNAALSVSNSAVGALASIVLMPFNFAWMAASTPGTAAWLTSLAIDPSAWWAAGTYITLLLPVLLAVYGFHVALAGQPLFKASKFRE